MSTSLALLIGAASHLAWDAFTHERGTAVQLLPVLASQSGFAALNVPWFKILQHASTVFGLAALARIGFRWAAAQPAVPRFELVLRATALAVAPLALGALNGLRFISEGLQPFVVNTGVAFTFAVGLIPVLLGMNKFSRQTG